MIYGDASQPVVLEAAGAHRARAMLVTVPAFPDVRSIVTASRQLRPALPIIARADSSEAVHRLYALGIQEVTSPEFEAAIEMTRQALVYLNVAPHDVLRAASAIRHERYERVGDKAEQGLAIKPQIGQIARHLDFAWVDVPTQSLLAGRTLGELRIRTTTGASIVGIIRGSSLVANPDGNARLQKGDRLAVLGTRDQIARFQQAMRADIPALP